MKRFLLVFLGGLFFNAYAFAQLSSSIQTGKATHELKGGGLIAAHFNIPLGSRVKISNTETGKEIEVTIRGRIPLSTSRIIDLSLSAWDALGLTPDTDVRLVLPPSVYEANRASPGDAQEAERFDAPGPEAAGEDWGAAAAEGDEFAELADEGEELDEAPAAVAGREEPKVQRPAVQPRRPIKIIPGLPDPNSRKFYRLQIGAFSQAANADEFERRAKALGFVTEREKHGSLIRVIIVGIRAPDVKLAAQELESAGFAEIWVRE